jgi:choline kinase
MATIDKAIILAAGLGNRISAISKDTPKPLLSLDGTSNGLTFLDWHLMALSKAGVREIYIVGNKKTHGTKLHAMSEVKAEWILNPTDDLSTSGSGHSTWFAFKSDHKILDSKSRVVLMDADILYDTSLFQTLSDAPGSRSKTLVCRDYRHTHEEVLVFGDPRSKDTPRYHGKGLLGTPLVADCTCLGEATGILLWEPQDHQVLSSVTDWTISFSTAKARSEHEDITQRMMLLDRMDAVRFGRERAFMEVDTPEEYEVMVREMYPKLKRA